jgi:acyl carrier protein
MRVRLNRLLRDVFNDPGLYITDELSTSTYAGWNSLAQVNLIMALEEEFGIQFTTEEVTALNSVAAIREALRMRI